MNIIVVPDTEWAFGSSESFYSPEHQTLYIRQTNSMVSNSVPVDSIPIEDESELMQLLFPSKPKEFSLTDYANNLTQDKNKFYSSDETVRKIMEIKAKVEYSIHQENIKLAEQRQAIKDAAQAKVEMAQNISQLETNLNQHQSFFNSML